MTSHNSSFTLGEKYISASEVNIGPNSNGVRTIQNCGLGNQLGEQEFHLSNPDFISPEAIVKHTDELTKNTLEAFEHLRVTKEKNIPQHFPTVTIGGAAFASRRNLSVISAPAKAGKTALTGVIIAGAISKTGEIDGFPDLDVIPNPEGKAVIQLDTEQSEEDQQYNLNTILKRAGMNETPDYFRAYNIRQLGLNEYRKVTDKICDLCSDKFNGVHMIVIDGGADYVESVNDEASATNIIQYFTHLSIKHDCPVIMIIHQNPGSDKERGHIGSQAQRKCFGLVSIERDGDISTIKPKIMRKASLNDMPLIHFRYSKERGFHVPVEAPDRDADKAKAQRRKIEQIAEKVFSPPSAYRTNDAIRKIAQSENVSESTAKRYLRQLDVWECIVKGNDDHFRINSRGVKWGQVGSN